MNVVNLAQYRRRREHPILSKFDWIESWYSLGGMFLITAGICYLRVTGKL